MQIPGLSDPGIPIYPPFAYLSFTPNFAASGAFSFGIDSQGLVNNNPKESFFFYNPVDEPATGIKLTGGISANLQGSIGVAALRGGLHFNANLNLQLNDQLCLPRFRCLASPVPRAFMTPISRSASVPPARMPSPTLP